MCIYIYIYIYIHIYIYIYTHDPNQSKNHKGMQHQSNRHQNTKNNNFSAMHKKTGVFVDPIFSLEGAVSKQPLSIVLISLDTVRADSLSIYGGRTEVPNLEKLASQSIVFSQEQTLLWLSI